LHRRWKVRASPGSSCGASDLRFPFPEAFGEKASGRTIVALGRRAKYLLIDLDDGNTIISHLGMSGSFRIEAGPAADVPGDTRRIPPSPIQGREARSRHLPSGRARRPSRVIYNDPRRFGFMDMAARRARHQPVPLRPRPGADGQHAERRLSRRALQGQGAAAEERAARPEEYRRPRQYICLRGAVALAPEADARRRHACDEDGKPNRQMELLVASIRDVIADAILAGGSSLRDHIQTDGSLGYFQHSFSVYDREGQPCRTPGCGGTVARIVQAGRSTFYCPAARNSDTPTGRNIHGL
jgi:formamidopyrimidine-DNA glycosylase